MQVLVLEGPLSTIPFVLLPFLLFRGTYSRFVGALKLLEELADQLTFFFGAPRCTQGLPEVLLLSSGKP